MALEVAMARRSLLPPPRFRRACRGRRWPDSGLPCDHGQTSCRARATRRYVANDGARNVDFECFLGSSGTRPLHTVPLQRHPKQCADKNLRPPNGPKRHRRFYLAVSDACVEGAISLTVCSPRAHLLWSTTEWHPT